MARHEHKFIITEQATEYFALYGYCGNCYADMQQFKGDKQPRHYNSHKRAKSLGLWGKS